MNNEKELIRHNKIINEIKTATKKEELPNIGYFAISSFLANNVYFEYKLNQKEFYLILNEMKNYGTFYHINVKKAFIKVMLDNYKNITIEQIEEKYNEIAKHPRIPYILNEINEKSIKLNEFIKKEQKEAHEKIMKQINNAFEIKDLPKVGLTELNKEILKIVNDNDFYSYFKTNDIKKLTIAYLEEKSYEEIEIIIEEIIENYIVKDKILMKQQIFAGLLVDDTIKYVVEEIKLKEKRKLKIYELDHQDIMEQIKDATRISQLPLCSAAILTNYINGNTTIYQNDDRIKTNDLKNLTNLLLEGKKLEGEEVKEEIKKIATEKYPDKIDAYELLYKKILSLPRLNYLIEEVIYNLSRQKEFIGNQHSNVNIYFIPNAKRVEGGRFYNCYINRIGNLDLSQILPLDLDKIVPPKMDIDSVEWYVQQNYDPTFKIAGGIILHKDETIGNINVFTPNESKISDLNKEIEKKQDQLLILEEQIKERQKETKEIEDQMQMIINNYEKKALELQKEMLNSIQELKKQKIKVKKI